VLKCPRKHQSLLEKPARQLLLQFHNFRHSHSSHTHSLDIVLPAFLDVRIRTPRCDSFGIDVTMTLGVIFFDMLKVGRFLESRDIPVQPLQPVVYLRIVMSNRSKVGLEMLN
jgi:hypothetical protein